jgi:hypothetical protein
MEISAQQWRDIVCRLDGSRHELASNATAIELVSAGI